MVPMEVVRSGKRMGTAFRSSTSLADCVVLPHRSTPSNTMKHPRGGAAAGSKADAGFTTRETERERAIEGHYV